MPKVEIKENGCRGCSMCVARCPVDVFEQIKSPKGNLKATVSRPEACMGCFGCYYICPSQCIHISEVVLQRPFYRSNKNTPFSERFLGIGATTQDLTEAEWEEAYQDVSMTLVSLARAVESTVGRGMSAVGRKAGMVAAQRIPEVFEEEELIDRLKRLQQRFHHSFDFEFEIRNNKEIKFTFMSCSLFQIVETKTREKVGEATLCRLFHDFFSGLISRYSGNHYRCTTVSAGISEKKCELFFSS
ncbi:MAG: 4Fe-4S dicluster domain-containing protein [Pseudomonadota bacterium]|nr:4Fe-4S dicluster domain-containing protein [Pseudomonadota bacterium]